MTTTEPIHGDVTPMMHQYLQIKREYRDAILFFRLGDFYEMFFDDAKIASALLGLALTSREAGKDNRVPMCGIPYHAAETYIARLIAAAHKVAICEQVEDPKQAKGIVKRDIIRVVTPSTIMGQAALLQHQNNYLVSVYQRSSHEYGVAAADVSTGEFKLTELDREEKMLSELTRLAPAEILLSAGITGNPALLGKIKQRVAAAISEVEEWTFDYSHSYERLTAHFKTQTLRGFGCEEMPLAISAAGAALRYLEHTQKTDLAHIAALTPYALNKFMVLDSIAQRNLELVRTLRGDKKATLLAELNFTRTAMGSRLIQHWIQQPLIDIAEINARLDAVAELLAQPALRTQLHETLKPVADIERLLGRISVGIANARDVHALNQSLKIIPGLKTILGPACSPLLSDTREALCECAELAGRIDATIREDAPLSVREGRMIRPGADKELDELLRISNGGKEWIAALQQREISRTGINSLKIKYNRVFGYYIEITKTNLQLVPADYIRKQTLVNAERFITPELKEQEDKILSAQERIIEREYELFAEICRQVLGELSAIQSSAVALATIDVLNSFAEAAARNHYVRPQITSDTGLTIKGGRHPVVENLLTAGKFIPNDTLLDCDDNQVLIITGPNMAGKSTYIRQVALLVIMAQMGCFIPAQEARIGIVDRIFTRIGAADDITAGMSTFMMEMSETANILHNATSRSMIILDEIGRGTSTFDGLSIAWATAEYLRNNQNARPRTLFATHYHELAEMELLLKGIKNYNVAVREWNDEVIFLYKLMEGAADHSYGIHVARLAGLPRQVIHRAREILSNLEINSMSADGIPSLVKSGTGGKHAKDSQPELFQRKENAIINELRSLDSNRMTPLEALTLIEDWKQKLKERNGHD